MSNRIISSFCNRGDCPAIQPTIDGSEVDVFDTKNPEIRLTFSRAEWLAFVAGVRAGEFDLPEEA